MAATTLALQCHHAIFSLNHIANLNSSKSSNLLQSFSTRRIVTSTTLATIFLAKQATSNSNLASSFDLRITVPDQTLEEAETGIKDHVQGLLQVKALIDSESWRDAQKALRESSAYVRQDLYTIIQAKPGNQRPQLRKLYSDLFNSVTRLDYAARSKDAARVHECFDNIVEILNYILAMI
eukprot:TRINITY_DN17722_c0_g1_i1.p1 TRINITY_DN17722_c0_g1~~TRINITY_DN17722_c0_g1_i1.p1  ORF type:complete len:192 (+),score=24.30 TRINITY_DN17722_c0_g1_i1:39-578(+)